MNAALVFVVLVVQCFALAFAEPQVEKRPEATSLLGVALFPPELSAESRGRLEQNLAAATASFIEDPDDPENIIWLGRRLAYLSRYREAIEVYSRGIRMHPRNFKVLRHRGHRYITVREFAKAIADLEKATQLIRGAPDEIEPDGAPNARNIPTSTSHFNIWYHLGLAYYLKGDFENALRAYRECMKFSVGSNDRLVATSDWFYMILRRLKRDQEAANVLEPIRKDMEIIENTVYHDRLLLYKGEKKPEELLNLESDNATSLATYGYGVGNWYLYNGQTARAQEIFEKVVKGTGWAAFGFIAAEAELIRMR